MTIDILVVQLQVISKLACQHLSSEPGVGMTLLMTWGLAGKSSAQTEHR